MCECAGGAGIPFDCILWATDTHLAFRIFFALDEVEAHPLIHDGDLLLAATRNAVSTPSREARLPPGRSGARTLKLNARTCSCVWVSDSASASCSSATSRARSAFCTATAFEPETTLSVRLRAHGEDARACAAEQSRQTAAASHQQLPGLILGRIWRRVVVRPVRQLLGSRQLGAERVHRPLCLCPLQQFTAGVQKHLDGTTISVISASNSMAIEQEVTGRVRPRGNYAIKRLTNSRLYEFSH
jgi:hypothetical protein